MRAVYITIATIIFLGFGMSFTRRPASGTLAIGISHCVGNKVMELDTVNYTNALGQPFTITKFKYYIGNISLHKADGTSCIAATYFLVDEEHPESKQIVWNEVPVGEYTDLSFIIGVDSAHNCTGLQSGALDPVNAMFWTWNTGYVFLKLEGKSPLSTSPGRVLEYHIGGFREPTNSIRAVTLHFSKPLVIAAGTAKLQLKADALEVLKTPTAIDFAKLSSVTDAHNAPMIADNYSDMFFVIGH